MGRRGAVVQLLCTIVLTAFVTTVVLGVAHLRTTAVASRGTTADIAVVRVDGDREHAVPLGAR